MAAKFDVRADVREVERALGGMKNGTATVVTRSLNKAIRKGQSTAVKEIAKELPAVTQKRIRSATRLKLANRNQWTADVSAKGLRIPLIELAARQTQRGVTYRTQEGRRLLPSSFIATMASGHKGVFKRFGPKREMRSGNYKGQRRQPIVELFGASVPRVFVQRHVEARIDSDARAEWDRESVRQVELLAKRSGLK